MVLSGVFERFPRLKFVMTEAGCAWVPPLLEQLDETIRGIRDTGATGEIRYSDEHVLPQDATEYFHQNCWMGVSQPAPGRRRGPPRRSASTGSCGAATTRTTRARTRTPGSTCGPGSPTSPEDEMRKILAGNAAKLYDFDLDKLAPLAAKIGPTVDEVEHPHRRDTRQDPRPPVGRHGSEGDQVSDVDGAIQRQRRGPPAATRRTRWSSSTTRRPGCGGSPSTGRRSATR